MDHGEGTILDWILIYWPQLYIGIGDEMEWHDERTTTIFIHYYFVPDTEHYILQYLNNIFE